MDENLQVEFYKKNGKLYILVSGLENMMNEIIKNSDEMNVEGMIEMQEIILQFLDKGRVTALTDFP